MYGNRTHCERLPHPPLVLKTRPGTSRGNTPGAAPDGAADFITVAESIVCDQCLNPSRANPLWAQRVA